MSRFRPPVRPKGTGYVIDVGADESALIRRLVGELRGLLADESTDPSSHALLARLFPVVHPDDDELEAEYQRLMRDELVQSKLEAFEIVDEVLAGDGRLDEGQLVAVMQSINSIRLVLGTMLGVSDDPDGDEVLPAMVDSSEYHLYGYLSWLLEWCVRALTRA
jgi:hypothetical protein